MFLDQLAKLSPRLRGLKDEIESLNRALAAQTARAVQEAQRGDAAQDQVDLLEASVGGLQKRIEDLEAALYVARSEQQRSAVLADDLRSRLAARPNTVA